MSHAPDPGDQRTTIMLGLALACGITVLIGFLTWAWAPLAAQ